MVLRERICEWPGAMGVTLDPVKPSVISAAANPVMVVVAATDEECFAARRAAKLLG
jgi:acetate kinase